MILVDVYVPSVNKQFDYKLDENVYIANIVEEIGGMMVTIANDVDKQKVNDLMLCDYELNRILPLDATLKQCNITNGSRLVLI